MSTPNSPALVIPKTDLASATLLPYTQNADGSWTAVSSGAFASGAVSLLNYLDSIVLTIDQMLMEAISVDASYMNRIPTLIDAHAVVTENQRRSQTTSDGPYTPICTTYGMVKLAFAWTKVGSHCDVVTMYGAWRTFNGGVQGVGGQKVGMALELIDTSYTTVGAVAGIAPISITRA